MAESGFSNFITLLAGQDVFSLLLPFLLAWMLYYAMIEKANIFNDTSLDGAEPVMAVILAFFTARFLVVQSFYQTFFSAFFGKIVIGLASLLGLYTLLAFSGWDLPTMNGDDDISKAIMYTGAAMAGAAFIWAGGFGPALFGPDAILGPAGTLGEVISGFIASPYVWVIPVGVAIGVIMLTGNRNGTNTGDGGGGDDGDDS